ncbi:MAG: hypothetical protein EZS28_052194, partial [Streblomastix strix]
MIVLLAQSEALPLHQQLSGEHMRAIGRALLAQSDVLQLHQKIRSRGYTVFIQRIGTLNEYPKAILKVNIQEDAKNLFTFQTIRSKSTNQLVSNLHHICYNAANYLRQTSPH